MNTEEPYPLPESLYPDSKDWVASDYAGRVEWLHFMYESKKREVEQLETAQPDLEGTAHIEAGEPRPANVVRQPRLNAAGFFKRKPLTDEALMALLPGAVRLPPGWKDFARAIEKAHEIGESK